MRKTGLDDFLAALGAFQAETFRGCERVPLDAPILKPMAAWYQRWERRQRDGGSEKGLTKELADEIQKKEHFARDASGRLYRYAKGVYLPDGAAIVAANVKQVLEINHDTRSWSTHRASEVAAWIAVDAPTLLDRPSLDSINLANGILRLATRTLEPHTPDYRSLIQLPLTYDPAGTCSEWDAFLRDVFPEDCQLLAYEIVAWLLCPDTRIQKAFLFRGDGENGKSTLLAAITAALGAGNVAGLSLQKLETDRFAAARLFGKLANICPDLPSDHLASTSIFKALVGGDRLLGEHKYGESFEFLPFARLLFSANHFPQSKDSSFAFFRRWEVIPFDRTITLEQKRAKPDILARLTSGPELSGLLNKCLDVLPALRSRGGFIQTETTRAARIEFQEYTDPLAVWIDRNTVLDPNGVITKKDLFVRYSAESEEAGRPIAPARTFYAAVKRLRPTLQETMRRVNGNPRDVFIGLTFRETVSGVSDVSCTPLPSELCEQGKEREKYKRGVGDSAYTAYTPDTPRPLEADVVDLDELDLSDVG